MKGQLSPGGGRAELVTLIAARAVLVSGSTGCVPAGPSC
jgi:hypothetical protein